MVRHSFIVVIIAVVTVILFFPVFLKGMVPIPADYMLAWYEPWKTYNSVQGVPTIAHKPVVDDAFRHLYPLRVLASSLIKQGQLPLWNPYNAAGTPLLAIMHPGYLTPFGIFFLFFPPTVGWTFYILLQIPILGITTYWYTKRLKMSDVGSIFTVLTLLLSGFVIVRLEYGEFLYVLSGLPILLGVVEVCRENIQSRSALVVPFVTAMMFISGQPHMILYGLGIFAAYALVRLPFFTAVRTVSFALLGAGLAAIQLLPGLELYMQSTINRHTSAFIFERFLLPVSHLVTIFIPNYFGNRGIYNYFGPHDYTETTTYLGLVPMFFALVAVRHVKTAVVAFFSAVIVAAVLLTLDWPGTRLFYTLPIPVLSSDVPSRIFVLLTFSVAVLGGLGITIWETFPWKKVWPWLLCVGMLVVLICISTVAVYGLHVPCPPEVTGCRMVSVRMTLIETAGFIVFIIASWFAFRIRTLRVFFGVGIPLLIILLLGAYNAGKFLPFSSRDRVFSDIGVFSAIRKEAGFGRYFGIGSADFRTNLTTYYGLQSLQYFDPLHLRRYAELVSFVNTADRQKDIQRSDVNIISDATVSAALSFRRERYLDMTGTNVLVTNIAEQIPAGSVKRWEDAYWRVNSRSSALPRAYFVRHIEIEKDPGAELAALFSSSFDLGTTAFVETPLLVKQESASDSGYVRIDSYEANTVSLYAESPTTTLLVLSDVYYPGWKARVDGKETTIYRTNYAFRGIVAPQGKHRIVFSYEPDSVRIGIWVTVLSFVAWVLISVYWKSIRGKR